VTAPIKELVYDRDGDTLQLWLLEGPLPSSTNVHQADGLYRVVDAEDETRLLGWEIVNFRHYAALHAELRVLLDALDRLPSRSVTLYEPTPGAGLTQLLHA
jgi:hypothetical protein